MTKPLIQLDNPKLKAQNQPITDFFDPLLKSLLNNLKDTMRSTDLVGIAAPQIGENFQVFLTEPRETKYRSKDQSDVLRVYINPKIIQVSEEESIIYEGCGSVGYIDVFGPVKRPKEVTVEAFDQTGKRFQLTTDGLLARVIQHELDHLHGIEFLEKADQTQLLSFKEYQKFKQENPELQKVSVISKIRVKNIR